MDYTYVRVEFDSGDWSDAETGDERPPTPQEMNDLFKSWAEGTTTELVEPPTKGGETAYWYGTFKVPSDREMAFRGLFDWAILWQVVGIVIKEG